MIAGAGLALLGMAANFVQTHKTLPAEMVVLTGTLNQSPQ